MKSKIMVLRDGETFTSIQGCQIVEIDDDLSTYEIEECLDIIYRSNDVCSNARILGGFDENGDYHVGDPSEECEKKVIKLE
jgi:hypothetical protein